MNTQDALCEFLAVLKDTGHKPEAVKAALRFFAGVAQPEQPAPQNLQKRLADLHLYEEIAEHYAKCAVSPEALRDWVAAAIRKGVTP